MTQQGNIVAPVSLLTRLDATEVLGSLGIAMYRRWQLLGPLAPHSSLSTPLQEMFSRQPRQRAGWVLASWSVLHGLSSLSTDTGLDPAEKLRGGVLANGQFDYFMSPLALVVLAERDAREGKYQAAIAALQEASLLAAQYEQHVWLAESIRNLSSCAAASQRADLIDPIQQSAAWCAKRSLLSHATGLLGAAELCIYAGNLGQADKLQKQALLALRGREVVVPRLQAQASFVAAKLAFAQDRGLVGLSNLEAALNRMRGTAQTGPVVAAVFQAQRTLDWLAAARLTSRDAERVLTEVLAEPAAIAWQNAPLETLATITTASLPAYERHLQLGAASGDTAEMIRRMDRLQRQRLYEALPLGGRLFCWRLAAVADPQALPPDVRQSLQEAIQRWPRLQTVPQQIGNLVGTLRQAPLPLDERQLSTEAKKTFAQIEELSSSHENLLAFQSLSRRGLPRFLPDFVTPEQLQAQLHAGDVLVSWVATGEQIYGAAVTPDDVAVWQVADVELVRSSLNKLLVEIGLVRQQAGQLPSSVTAATAAWRKTAADLHQRLIPPEISALIQPAKRLILAPNDQLWYVPYELLPEQGDPQGDPWIARRAITYVPTLGSVGFAFAARPNVNQTVGLVDSFFFLNRESNLQQADLLAQSIPNTSKILLTQKVTAPSAHWLRLRADQVWVASEIDGVAGWDADLFPLGKPAGAPLGGGTPTPFTAPARLFFPGCRTSMPTGKLGNGNDLFLAACSLMFGGSRSAILSRWPVGGISSQRMLQRCLEEFPHEPPAQAMRRAILALWVEDFLTADERVLLPAGKEADALTSGRHPMLWSGYMSVGDTRP